MADSLLPAPKQSARDPWFGRDKLLHFTASMLIQSTAHSVFRARGADFYQASVGAGIVTATAGIGKEKKSSKIRFRSGASSEMR